MFVAPSTRQVLPTVEAFVNDSMLCRKTFFTARPEPPESFSRLPNNASISSMKMIEGARSFAKSNNLATCCSLSPWYLDMMSDGLTWKKVDVHAVAQAFARYVLPVPGGPYIRMPLGGGRSSENILGNFVGSTTANFSWSLAISRPAMSSQSTFGLSLTMVPSSTLPSSPPPPACTVFFGCGACGAPPVPPPPPPGDGDISLVPVPSCWCCLLRTFSGAACGFTSSA
mmetsp:Transcript_54378/g.126899  ORF Transcript_54378/g.126899 Transcript_54378/m.126899 type:complete len:227 (-) Transcript_54378:1014-1694(-)